MNPPQFTSAFSGPGNLLKIPSRRDATKILISVASTKTHALNIPMASLVIIWDFRLRILDLWNRYALSFFLGVNI